MTEFVHRRGVDFKALHLSRRLRVDGDLPAKIDPIRELGAGSRIITKKVGIAVDNSYATSVEVDFFVKVGVQYSVPESERLPESIWPRLRCVDLDPDIPDDRLPQILKLRARQVRTRPI